MSPLGSTHSPVVPIATPFDLTDYPELAGINSITGTGLVARISTGVYATRTLTGTTNQVTVTDGNGVAGNPTISLPQNIHTAATPTFAGITLSGMTSGSVFFAGTSGVVSQDNANLFWDDTNNRLGIGTTSLSSPLHILKTAAAAITPAIRVENLSSSAGTGASIDFYHDNAGTTATGRIRFQRSTLGAAFGDYFIDLGASGSFANVLSGNVNTGMSTNGLIVTSNDANIIGSGSQASAGKFTRATTDSTSIFDALYLIRNPSTAASAGMGVSMAFAAKGSNGVLYDTARIRSVATTVTAGAMQTYLSFDTAKGAPLSESLRIDTSGNLLIGTTTTTASGGLIQLATGTTAATGILWGTDTNLYRSAANTLKTDDTFTVAADLIVTPTASANRNVTITGSNGGNPTIGVSAGSLAITPATVFASTITTIGGATFHITSTALTDGAGVAAGTLLTAPTAGNPSKWLGINDNGTVRYIPSW